MKTWLVVPDLHVPYHCKLFVKLITAVICKVKPYGVVQLGDAVDCPQISKYPKDPERVNTVFDDIIEYKQIMDTWHSLSGGMFYQLEGNHEDRLRRFIWSNAPHISKMVRTVPDLLDINGAAGAKWFELSNWKSCSIGDVSLFHGTFYNKHVAVTNLERYPTKSISGHTHRVHVASNGQRWAVSLGHGSDETLTSHNPVPTGWQQAFGLLHDVNGIGHFETVLVDRGRCVLHGEVIDAKRKT